MLVHISGSRCVSCDKYTQYYAQVRTRSGQEMQAVDRGYCGQRQCTTRPGSRCRYYLERSNVGPFYRIVKDYETKEEPC